VLFQGAAYQKSQSAVFMLPENGVPSAVVWTVRRWCLDCAAGPEKSSTSEVQRLQKFCRRNCRVFAAPRKSERKLRAPSVVGHEAAVICQVEKRLPEQRLTNQTCHFELDTLSDG